MTETAKIMPGTAPHVDDLPANGLAGTIHGNPKANRISARRACVLVLGMHRSGSSAITRMLSLLGCGLPKTLMPGNETNPRGHWESDAVAQLNDEILALAGTSWDDWHPVNARLPQTLVWPQLVARGVTLLREEFADAPLFVLKDPRICRLGAFWLEVLAAEQIEPAFVLPLRNPLEVARSLAVRNGIQEHTGLLIWLRHVLAAEAVTRGRARVFTEYATLLNDWEGLAARLSAGLGLVWPRVSPFGTAEISQFLTPDLRHHVRDTGDLTDNPQISSWLRDTYAILLSWARHGENSGDYPKLNAILRDFDEAGAAFAQPLLSSALAERRARDLAVEHEALVEERDRLSANGEVIAAERDALASRVAETAAQLLCVQSELGGLIAERGGLANDRAALAQERDTLAGQLAEEHAGYQQVCGERDAVIADLERFANECAGLAAERDKMAARLSSVEADMRKAEAKNAAVEACAAVLERDLGNALSAVEEEKYRCALAKSTLRQREEENFQLETELKKTIARAERDLTVAAENLRCAADSAKRQSGEAEQARLQLVSDAKKREQEVVQLHDALARAKTAQLTMASRMEAELAQMRDAKLLAEDRAARAQTENDFQNQRLAERLTEVTTLSQLLRQSEASAQAATSEIAHAELRLEKSSTELFQLSKLLRKHEQQALDYGEKAEWLRQVSIVLRSMPRWWSFMPRNWNRAREAKRLRQKGLFDEQAYLDRYTDVAEQRMDPLEHYLRHGWSEGRDRC